MNDRKRILLVEDEPHLAFNLAYNLQAEGFDVVPAVTGQIAIKKWEQEGPFSLIILDVMLPERNGFEVARAIRATDKRTGILMLTARAHEADVIQGLESGADDYMTKPFHLQEFLLRVKRMAERSEFLQGEARDHTASSTLRLGKFQLDPEGLTLTGPTETFKITDLEAGVLKEFLSNPGTVLTRAHLLREVWGMRAEVESRTVDNFIVRLRKYLESDPGRILRLESVRGKGYRLIVKEDKN